MSEEREQERLRCRERYEEIGPYEYNRLRALQEEAQMLCAKLVLLKDPRRERLLRMAEDRRERRAKTLWPWFRYYDRNGVLQ